MREVPCANCGAPAYLSRRRGLREGIALRLLRRAVFRCSHCGRRWSEYSPDTAFRRARRSETFTEYIGWGDAKGQQLLLRIVLVVAVVVIMGATFVTMKRRFAAIHLNAAGQSVGEPKVSTMRPTH